MKLNPFHHIGICIQNMPYRKQITFYWARYKQISNRGQGWLEYGKSWQQYALLLGVYLPLMGYNFRVTVWAGVIAFFVFEAVFFCVGWFDFNYFGLWREEMIQSSTTYNPILSEIYQTNKRIEERLIEFERRINNRESSTTTK